jgi:hypothetical protein
VTYITKKSDPSVGIWTTNEQTRRHVDLPEWEWITAIYALGGKPAPVPLPLDDAHWDDLPDVKTLVGATKAVSGQATVAIDLHSA